MSTVPHYERRFRRAGLPLFVQGFSASTSVFNRVVPLLGLVFLGELLGAIDLNWSLAGNIAAVAGGIVILFAGVGLVNRARGRPFLAVPETVGRIELGMFVIVPALLPLIFGGQWRSALVTGAANLLLLALIYAIVGYGLLSIVRWALGRLVGQLRASLALFTRAIPLLMIFSVVLFLTTEMWQAFSDAPEAFLAVLLGLFVALGTAFLVARIPREVEALEREAGEGGPPLDRRERLNVGLVLFVSQGLQVLFVSLAIAAFFLALGVLVVDQDLLDSWIGHRGNVLVAFDLLGDRAVLTEELLRVAGAIAAFTGLYFAISMLTDSLYRQEFLEELTGEMEESFRARAEYRRLLAG